MYEVHVVGKTDLPVGYDWAMVQKPDGRMMLFVRETVTALVLAEAWAAGRMLRRPRVVRTVQRPALQLLAAQ